MDDISKTKDIMQDIISSFSPEVIQAVNNDLPGFINGSLSDLKECERKKDAALLSATMARNTTNDAIAKAKTAKEISSGLFKRGQAIDGLKSLAEVQSQALDDISQALIDQANAMNIMFENQKKQAVISRNLSLLGMGNQAIANTVLKRLKEGIESGEMSNISEDIYQEFERIVMWWSHVEDINAKIRKYEEQVSILLDRCEALSENGNRIRNDLSKQNEKFNKLADKVNKSCEDINSLNKYNLYFQKRFTNKTVFKLIVFVLSLVGFSLAVMSLIIY